MIYIACKRASDSARQLVAAINTLQPGAVRRIRRANPTFAAGDTVVWWGTAADIVPPTGVRFLNPTRVGGKYAELARLAAAGVTVPAHSRTRPVEQGWLARRNHHMEADDLLANLETGDYYVRYVPVSREFRVHVFNAASIRTGLKVPRLDNPHPRFRSWQAGWKLDYGAACQAVIRQVVRESAKAAVAALGYNFGAVDIGVQTDGAPVVFEVNSAPGLEGNTISVYARHILAAGG